MKGRTVLAFVFIQVMLSLVQLSAAGGPCSTTGNIVIEVYSEADIISRAYYPPTEKVILVLQKSFTVSSTIKLDSAYSCTIFQSADTYQPYTISGSSDRIPLFTIIGAHNILVQQINLQLPISASSPACPLALDHIGSPPTLCPALYIAGSWGVQVAQAEILGRIDVFNSSNIGLDSLSITSINSDRCAVQFSFVGDGPQLILPQISLTNSWITGGYIGVLLTRAAVGVTISNNFLRNQKFMSIHCGKGNQNVGDCMLTTMTNNYVTVDPGYEVLPDSSAFYFATHWINPGNYLQCNYVVGGQHCLYLDFCSSGVVADGHVCFNTSAGLKLNTGHYNTISGFLNVKQHLPGWISCQNYDVNNCNPGSLGQGWDRQRTLLFNSDAVNTRYPWLSRFCGIKKQNGVSCNPAGSVPARVSGGCSGLPTDNVIASMAIVDPLAPLDTPTYLQCEKVTNVDRLNSMTWKTYYSSSVGLNSYAESDFGLHSSSPILSDFPNFRSCPKAANGPQDVELSAYLQQWNKHK